MNLPISPWIDDIVMLSPDGKYTAHFYGGMEVAMGAPTMGTLSMRTDSKGHIICDHAAASMIWSDDSRFLAFSEWTKSKQQSLCVYRVADNTIQRVPSEYRVLELHKFSAGQICGVDSPIHRPHKFNISFSNNAEQNGSDQASTRSAVMTQFNFKPTTRDNTGPR